MKKQHYQLPRYIVTKPWPCLYGTKQGDIYMILGGDDKPAATGNVWAVNRGTAAAPKWAYSMTLRNPEAYPKNIRPLKWWECLAPDDFPQFVTLRLPESVRGLSYYKETVKQYDGGTFRAFAITNENHCGFFAGDDLLEEGHTIERKGAPWEWLQPADAEDYSASVAARIEKNYPPLKHGNNFATGGNLLMQALTAADACNFGPFHIGFDMGFGPDESAIHIMRGSGNYGGPIRFKVPEGSIFDAANNSDFMQPSPELHNRIAEALTLWQQGYKHGGIDKLAGEITVMKFKGAAEMFFASPLAMLGHMPVINQIATAIEEWELSKQKSQVGLLKSEAFHVSILAAAILAIARESLEAETKVSQDVKINIAFPEDKQPHRAARTLSPKDYSVSRKVEHVKKMIPKGKPEFVETLMQLCCLTADGDLISKDQRDYLHKRGFIKQYKGFNVISDQGLKYLADNGLIHA